MGPGGHLGIVLEVAGNIGVEDGRRTCTQPAHAEDEKIHGIRDQRQADDDLEGAWPQQQPDARDHGEPHVQRVGRMRGPGGELREPRGHGGADEEPRGQRERGAARTGARVLPRGIRQLRDPNLEIVDLHVSYQILQH